MSRVWSVLLWSCFYALIICKNTRWVTLAMVFFVLFFYLMEYHDADLRY